MLIIVGIAWGPRNQDGTERRIIVQAASTVEMYRRLGEALGREAHWWGHTPTKGELTHALRTIEIVTEPDDVADLVLQTPPELTVSPELEEDDE